MHIQIEANLFCPSKLVASNFSLIHNYTYVLPFTQYCQKFCSFFNRRWHQIGTAAINLKFITKERYPSPRTRSSQKGVVDTGSMEPNNILTGQKVSVGIMEILNLSKTVLFVTRRLWTEISTYITSASVSLIEMLKACFMNMANWKV